MSNEDFEVDCAPNPIIKISIHDDDNWIETLDTMGNAFSLTEHDKRVEKTVKNCCEIFEHYDLFEQVIERDEKGKLRIRTA